MSESQIEKLKHRIVDDFPYWAQHFAKIVDKRGRLIPFDLKPGQLALDRELEAQRAAGKPMRAIILKARQIGFSTYVQAKLVHRCTLRERYDATVVAQDKETGARLYRMAETIYSNLPADEWLKPALMQHRRQQFLHFAGGGMWTEGGVFPDSRYNVDTAGEFQAGRGGTNRAIHASEVGLWPQIGEKLTSLLSSVPDEPETIFIQESTAKGFNEFKDWWDDAEAGRSEWLAFFWPWWKEEEYRRPFASELEREAFVIGDPTNAYAEEEAELVAQLALEPEQLYWRRQKIANMGGDVRRFHQEYPSTPEEAFISTGQKVFDPYKTAQLLVRCEITDPRPPTPEHPGPVVADLSGAEMRTEETFTGGTIEIPGKALLLPRERGVSNPTAPWRFWLEHGENGELKRDENGDLARPEGEYVIGVDVSGGNTETTIEPDYHAIEVIDHKTRKQVAEYRSRIDPDLLTMQVLLAALYFNEAWVAIERTGSWGAAPLRILWRDLHYPLVYRAKRTGGFNERTEDRLGWDTNVRTKPLLLAGMAELLRIDEDGIRSRNLADEVRTYTRTAKGTTEAEPGKYDDLLMAYMIAQHVASETPLRGELGGGESAEAGFRAPIGVASYDPRY